MWIFIMTVTEVRSEKPTKRKGRLLPRYFPLSEVSKRSFKRQMKKKVEEKRRGQKRSGEERRRAKKI